MTDVEVFGDQKTMARNPWVGTGLAKDTRYLRDPVPWDSREQGVKGLSSDQKDRIEKFTKAAKKVDCSEKSGMARNKCRVEKIGDRLD